MDKATTEPSGLVAIRSLRRDAFDSICKAHGAYVAIVNAEDQTVVGGTRKALDAVVLDVQAAGAERTTVFPVAVPSHTPLLAEASRSFRQRLGGARLPAEVPSGVRLLSGINGDTVFDVRAGADKLARQIQQTVDWAACMQSCRAAGVAKLIELGPGHALGHMMHEFMPDSDVHSLSEFHSLPGCEHGCRALPPESATLVSLPEKIHPFQRMLRRRSSERLPEKLRSPRLIRFDPEAENAPLFWFEFGLR